MGEYTTAGRLETIEPARGGRIGSGLLDDPDCQPHSAQCADHDAKQNRGPVPLGHLTNLPEACGGSVCNHAGNRQGAVRSDQDGST
jgi:hypothetical protein